MCQDFLEQGAAVRPCWACPRTEAASGSALSVLKPHWTVLGQAWYTAGAGEFFEPHINITFQTREISVLCVVSKKLHTITMTTKQDFFSTLNMNFEARALKIQQCWDNILQLRGQTLCFKILLGLPYKHRRRIRTSFYSVLH